MRTIRIDYQRPGSVLVSESDDGTHWRVLHDASTPYIAHCYASAFAFAYWVAGVACEVTQS
jgi:hypothetical protein